MLLGMGCGGSTQGTAHKGKYERGIYHELAEAIRLYERPSKRHQDLVRSNRHEEFKHPRGQPEKALLVLALDMLRYEWASLLLEKCDPNVTWRREGRKITIGEVLEPEMFREWKEAKARWSARFPAVDSARDIDYSEWKKGFPKAAAALGLLAAAVGAAGVAGAVGGACPPFSAGCSKALASVWKVYQEWKKAKDDGDCMFVQKDGLSQQLDDTLRSIMELQDERIEQAAADKAYQASVMTNISILSTLLDRQAKDMKACLSFQGGGGQGRRVGGLEDTKRRDDMMREMMTELQGWQNDVMHAYRGERLMFDVRSLSRAYSMKTAKSSDDDDGDCT